MFAIVDDCINNCIMKGLLVSILMELQRICSTKVGATILIHIANW